MDHPTAADAWTLLTSHGHVLVEVTRDPDARIRDISQAVGLTERTVTAILTDLERAGYITRQRVGRRTRYTVHPDNPFRHKGQDGYQVGSLLQVLTAPLAASDESENELGKATAHAEPDSPVNTSPPLQTAGRPPSRE